MLGLSQHLFAEPVFDLVMTSGDVSFLQRRSPGSGVLAGKGGGTVGEREKEGRRRMRSSERGAAPKVAVSQLRVHVLITDVAWGE